MTALSGRGLADGSWCKELLCSLNPDRVQAPMRGVGGLRPVLQEDEDSIKERIKEAFAQHKEDMSNIDTDAARLAAIRESDEKTSRRLAAIESKIDGDLAAMKTKIDNLTDMLQALLDKEQK